MCENTKGVLFYSTPHKGSPLAAISSQARHLLLPSVEVEELSQGGRHVINGTKHLRLFMIVRVGSKIGVGELAPLKPGLIRSHKSWPHAAGSGA